MIIFVFIKFPNNLFIQNFLSFLKLQLMHSRLIWIIFRCALRFERWYRCDFVYNDIRDKYDLNIDYNAKPKKYPCFKHFYEANYACADDTFEFLLEVAYSKKSYDLSEGDWSNREIQAFSTVYDTVHKTDRKTYSYWGENRRRKERGKRKRNNFLETLRINV